MKKIFLLFLIIITTQQSFSQYTISYNHRYLLKDRKPFYWLGDTGWELFQRLTKEETDEYLKRRTAQDFTVTQAVVLAEMDGLHTPNAYGAKPLINDDPTKPNEAYFKFVYYVIDKSNDYNLNTAMLPIWGDKINKGTCGALKFLM